MKITISTVILFVFALTMNSCFWFWNDAVKGNGDITQETRQLDAIRAVSTKGSFQVKIIHSNETYALIEAEANLIEHIVLGVKNGKLSIESEKDIRLKPQKSMVITVFTPTMENIELFGSGSVNADFLSGNKSTFSVMGSGSIYASTEAEELSASVNGSGYITLSGECTEADFKVQGSGEIRAFGCMANSVVAGVSGSGTISCNATDYLDASVTGSGTIVYRGNPEVKSSITGSGSIRPE